MGRGEPPSARARSVGARAPSRLASLGLLVVIAGTFGAETVARAQAERGRYTVGIGAEAADGRLALRTADRNERPNPRESFVFGVRLTAERRTLTRLSLELGLALHQHLVVELRMLEGTAGVRYFLPAGPHGTFFLRPLLGLALADLDRAQVGLGFGLSIGYRHRQNRTVSRFVELGYRMRVFPDADPGYADATFPDHGYHPEDAQTLFAGFLGVTFGVDFGPFPR